MKVKVLRLGEAAIFLSSQYYRIVVAGKAR